MKKSSIKIPIIALFMCFGLPLLVWGGDCEVTSPFFIDCGTDEDEDCRDTEEGTYPCLLNEDIPDIRCAVGPNYNTARKRTQSGSGDCVSFGNETEDDCCEEVTETGCVMVTDYHCETNVRFNCTYTIEGGVAKVFQAGVGSSVTIPIRECLTDPDGQPTLDDEDFTFHRMCQ